MTFQDAEELTEEEKSEWAMDIAYDMDEFFRQHDPQYAAEHPEEHAAKEEIYENLMAGRISALDEKLAALGQTQEDYLPSEIEKFKDATGYEEFLDFDPAVIKAALEDPDKSHVDEMLAFAEQAGREYEAELAGQTPAPSPDDRETGETVRTPMGTFYVTDMSREQMEAAGYGLHHMLYGNITKGASTLGSAGIRVPGSAGETSEALEASRGVPSLIMADGPAGLRLRQSYQVDPADGGVIPTGVLGSLENGFLDAPRHLEGADTYYQYCTAFPVGTALAQSWDPALLEEFGRAIAAEMAEFHIDLWLAPGMNIQRNPLCGRNFEYYAEDPLLSGLMAAAVTRGVQADGTRGVTIKHFACNNQEDHRMGVDARVSEQALREIYLRGFEIAVKTAAPAALMTSYNRINGVQAANNRDLCTVVARGEWGFDGLIMSDWNTTVPADGSEPWRCAAAGNDVIMPGNPHDDADIRAALADGRLAETDVRACAGRLMALARRLTANR